jgi:hypothetical protein
LHNLMLRLSGSFEFWTGWLVQEFVVIVYVKVYWNDLLWLNDL